MNNYRLTSQNIVDELAQFIRQVDGNNKMGAGSLAEKICERFHVADPAVQGEPVGYVRPHHLEMLRSGKACGITLEDKPDAHNRVTIPLYAAPQPAEKKPEPDVSALVEAAEAVLGEIEGIMQEAYNSAYPVCCGRPGSECCGSPEPEWEEADQRMMDRLAPHQKALRDALAAHRKGAEL